MNPAMPPPLPIPVRPLPGEHYTSYLHRLAEANHLRPSVLRAYVNDLARSESSFRIDRLAAISGRSVRALRNALTGETPAFRRARPGPRRKVYPKKRPETTVEGRLERDLLLAADEIRYLDQLDLFAAIRADADLTDASCPQLADRHYVGEDYVQDILRGRQPRPPEVSRRFKPAPTLEPVKGLIKILHESGLSTDEIWTELVDKHHAAVSKPTVKHYVKAIRSGIG